jgi:hypothetical protein
MRGKFKAKESYKGLSNDESFFGICEWKHNMLMEGSAVEIETSPRLLGKDLSEHLESVDGSASDEGIVNSNSEEVKSSDPSDNWTKSELKDYMIDNSIAFNSGDTKSDLLEKIKASKGDG